ncbi:hypothetical protein RF11_07357 [Thelohanellus kitauei]|uniref:Generative cell specific-1/HAP2 domain-containing protein n=1 Tax=Thelohanellus kitauei TaxID=669202 RepID=A0A0C2IUU5_THEKT|nr:hypothetical protein RF11_07357 [Thelohanellus kitauei]
MCLKTMAPIPSKLLPASQYGDGPNTGFCCPCFTDYSKSRSINRSTMKCMNNDTQILSLHCLEFDLLWYTVHQVLAPVVRPDIHIRLEYEMDNTKYTIGSIHLSNSAEISYFPQEKAMERAMIIDAELLDLTGMECDKVGISQTGFANFGQKFNNEACKSEVDTCLRNQPLDLYQDDRIRISLNQTPNYLIGQKFKIEGSYNDLKNVFGIYYVPDDKTFHHHLRVEFLPTKEYNQLFDAKTFECFLTIRNTLFKSIIIEVSLLNLSDSLCSFNGSKYSIVPKSEIQIEILCYDVHMLQLRNAYVRISKNNDSFVEFYLLEHDNLTCETQCAFQIHSSKKETETHKVSVYLIFDALFQDKDMETVSSSKPVLYGRYFIVTTLTLVIFILISITTLFVIKKYRIFCFQTKINQI